VEFPGAAWSSGDRGRRQQSETPKPELIMAAEQPADPLTCVVRYPLIGEHGTSYQEKHVALQRAFLFERPSLLLLRNALEGEGVIMSQHMNTPWNLLVEEKMLQGVGVAHSGSTNPDAAQVLASITAESELVVRIPGLRDSIPMPAEHAINYRQMVEPEFPMSAFLENHKVLLCEFIDNSIQYVNLIPPGQTRKIHLHIIIQDEDTAFIVALDNGLGMSQKDIKGWANHGETPVVKVGEETILRSEVDAPYHANAVLSRFGCGSKSAGFFLGETITAISCTPTSAEWPCPLVNELRLSKKEFAARENEGKGWNHNESGWQRPKGDVRRGEYRREMEANCEELMVLLEGWERDHKHFTCFVVSEIKSEFIESLLVEENRDEMRRALAMMYTHYTNSLFEQIGHAVVNRVGSQDPLELTIEFHIPNENDAALQSHKPGGGGLSVTEEELKLAKQLVPEEPLPKWLNPIVRQQALAVTLATPATIGSIGGEAVPNLDVFKFKLNPVPSEQADRKVDCDKSVDVRLWYNPIRGGVETSRESGMPWLSADRGHAQLACFYKGRLIPFGTLKDLPEALTDAFEKHCREKKLTLDVKNVLSRVVGAAYFPRIRSELLQHTKFVWNAVNMQSVLNEESRFSLAEHRNFSTWLCACAKHDQSVQVSGKLNESELGDDRYLKQTDTVFRILELGGVTYSRGQLVELPSATSLKIFFDGEHGQETTSGIMYREHNPLGSIRYWYGRILGFVVPDSVEATVDSWTGATCNVLVKREPERLYQASCRPSSPTERLHSQRWELTCFAINPRGNPGSQSALEQKIMEEWQYAPSILNYLEDDPSIGTLAHPFQVTASNGERGNDNIVVTLGAFRERQRRQLTNWTGNIPSKKDTKRPIDRDREAPNNSHALTLRHRVVRVSEDGQPLLNWQRARRSTDLVPGQNYFRIKFGEDDLAQTEVGLYKVEFQLYIKSSPRSQPFPTPIPDGVVVKEGYFRVIPAPPARFSPSLWSRPLDENNWTALPLASPTVTLGHALRFELELVDAYGNRCTIPDGVVSELQVVDDSEQAVVVAGMQSTAFHTTESICHLEGVVLRPAEGSVLLQECEERTVRLQLIAGRRSQGVEFVPWRLPEPAPTVSFTLAVRPTARQVVLIGDGALQERSQVTNHEQLASMQFGLVDAATRCRVPAQQHERLVVRVEMLPPGAAEAQLIHHFQVSFDTAGLATLQSFALTFPPLVAEEMTARLTACVEHRRSAHSSRGGLQRTVSGGPIHTEELAFDFIVVRSRRPVGLVLHTSSEEISRVNVNVNARGSRFVFRKRVFVGDLVCDALTFIVLLENGDRLASFRDCRILYAAPGEEFDQLETQLSDNGRLATDWMRAPVQANGEMVHKFQLQFPDGGPHFEAHLKVVPVAKQPHSLRIVSLLRGSSFYDLRFCCGMSLRDKIAVDVVDKHENPTALLPSNPTPCLHLSSSDVRFSDGSGDRKTEIALEPLGDEGTSRFVAPTGTVLLGPANGDFKLSAKIDIQDIPTCMRPGHTLEVGDIFDIKVLVASGASQLFLHDGFPSLRVRVEDADENAVQLAPQDLPSLVVECEQHPPGSAAVTFTRERRNDGVGEYFFAAPPDSEPMCGDYIVTASHRTVRAKAPLTLTIVADSEHVVNLSVDLDPRGPLIAGNPYPALLVQSLVMEDGSTRTELPENIDASKFSVEATLGNDVQVRYVLAEEAPSQTSLPLRFVAENSGACEKSGAWRASADLQLETGRDISGTRSFQVNPAAAAQLDIVYGGQRSRVVKNRNVNRETTANRLLFTARALVRDRWQNVTVLTVATPLTLSVRLPDAEPSLEGMVLPSLFQEQNRPVAQLRLDFPANQEELVLGHVYVAGGVTSGQRQLVANLGSLPEWAVDFTFEDTEAPFKEEERRRHRVRDIETQLESESRSCASHARMYEAALNQMRQELGRCNRGTSWLALSAQDIRSERDRAQVEHLTTLLDPEELSTAEEAQLGRPRRGEPPESGDVPQVLTAHYIESLKDDIQHRLTAEQTRQRNGRDPVSRQTRLTFESRGDDFMGFFADQFRAHSMEDAKVMAWILGERLHLALMRTRDGARAVEGAGQVLPLPDFTPGQYHGPQNLPQRRSPEWNVRTAASLLTAVGPNATTFRHVLEDRVRNIVVVANRDAAYAYKQFLSGARDVHASQKRCTIYALDGTCRIQGDGVRGGAGGTMPRRIQEASPPPFGIIPEPETIRQLQQERTAANNLESCLQRAVEAANRLSQKQGIVDALRIAQVALSPTEDQRPAQRPRQDAGPSRSVGRDAGGGSARRGRPAPASDEQPPAQRRRR